MNQISRLNMEENTQSLEEWCMALQEYFKSGETLLPPSLPENIYAETIDHVSPQYNQTESPMESMVPVPAPRESFIGRATSQVCKLSRGISMSIKRESIGPFFKSHLSSRESKLPKHNSAHVSLTGYQSKRLALKRVILKRTAKGEKFGFSVKLDGGRICISFVDSSIERLDNGDVVHAIDGITTESMSIKKFAGMVKSRDTIVLTINGNIIE